MTCSLILLLLLFVYSIMFLVSTYMCIYFILSFLSMHCTSAPGCLCAWVYLNTITPSARGFCISRVRGRSQSTQLWLIFLKKAVLGFRNSIWTLDLFHINQTLGCRVKPTFSFANFYRRRSWFFWYANLVQKIGNGTHLGMAGVVFECSVSLAGHSFYSVNIRL